VLKENIRRSMSQDTVSVTNLKKYFKGKNGPIKAVDGVNLSVKKGEIFGFLGPNGAGKTTTLRMLSTLLPIDEGEAIIAGFNVKTEPEAVRRNIGYVGQAGGADRAATGRENLILQGRLYDMSAKEVSDRADELIQVLDLKEFSDRIVHTYSGGQRRRLDVALGIMNKPQVLFLDEPTTGLDPQNRSNLWMQIDKLKKFGTTIFLTTHYLEEADVLSDRLAIMDHGKIVAKGTPAELKKEVSGDCVSLGLKDKGNTQKVIKLLKPKTYVKDIKEEGDSLRLYVKDGSHDLPQVLRLVDEQRIDLTTVTLSVPTLDDVFLKQTGHSLRDTEAEGGK
jgi:ABC-2 type transport system ATP-binding protein